MNNNQNNRDVFQLKDYRIKISQRITDNETVEAVNNFVNLINYCFWTRNNFMIDNFNKRNIHVIHLAYNKIKSNILSKDITRQPFDQLSTDEYKLLIFILNNFRTKSTLTAIITDEELVKISNLVKNCFNSSN